MGDVEYFRTYAHLVDGLIEKATKDRLADEARRLALNIGYDHEKHGDVPQEQLLRMVRAEMLSDEAKRLPVHGMQNLVSALGKVMRIEDEEVH